MKDKNKLQSCCFFGHRTIKETTELKITLYNTVENLIVKKDVKIFMFGSKSEFNSLCYEIVTELKQKYPDIKRVYVRAAFSIINDDYKSYLLERYEDTYFPEKIHNAGKLAYVERNYEMINNSNFCVVYYDENYAPPRRKNSKKESDYQPRSGTKVAYDYAVKRGLKITNILTVTNNMVNL